MRFECAKDYTMLRSLAPTSISSGLLSSSWPSGHWDTHYRVKAYPIDARQQFQFMSDITVRAKAALSNLGVAPATIPPPMLPPPVKGESLNP